MKEPLTIYNIPKLLTKCCRSGAKLKKEEFIQSLTNYIITLTYEEAANTDSQISVINKFYKEFAIKKEEVLSIVSAPNFSYDDFLSEKSPSMSYHYANKMFRSKDVSSNFPHKFQRAVIESPLEDDEYFCSFLDDPDDIYNIRNIFDKEKVFNTFSGLEEFNFWVDDNMLLRLEKEKFQGNHISYLSLLLYHIIISADIRKSKIPSCKNFFCENYVHNSDSFKKAIDECSSLRIIGLGQSRMVRAYMTKFEDLLKRGGTLHFILTDPDGASTQMSSRRSSRNRDGLESDRAVHIDTLDRLSDLRKDYPNQVKIQIIDFLFPYTMYGFDMENLFMSSLFIWMTALYEPSEKRLGFQVVGNEDIEIKKSFDLQFKTLVDSPDIKDWQ